MVNENEGQPTLKVMRLYKPKLSIGNSETLIHGYIMDKKVNHPFNLSNSMILPDSFGNIYLGETFCSYISTINHYTHSMKNVGLSAKLQTPSVRIDLVDRRQKRTDIQAIKNPVEALDGGSSLDMIFEHTLSEVGVHTLRVGVTYTHITTGEIKSLRKFYRFNVLNPLTIQFRNILVKDDSLIEAEIQNATQGDLFLDIINFLPMQPFQATELGKSCHSISGIDNFDNGVLLHPDQIFQKSFRVYTNDDAAKYGTANLGRLEIKWKTAFGEAGAMVSQPVIRKAPLQKEVEVMATSIPSSLRVGESFLAEFEIKNHCHRSLHLQLQFRRELMSGVFCSSLTSQNIGKLEPQTSIITKVELLPLVAGNQEIKGITVVDMQTSQEYPQEKVADVIIERC